MDIVAKKYRILKTLGQGAMGEVFLVLPPKGDPVALKFLKTVDLTHQQSAVSQFENEFKTLKKLSHPNIAKIFDFGFDEELKKVYFTTPWLKGTDIFVGTKDIPYENCEEYFVQLLRGINYLHQKGLIHCDLKPGNVYLENGAVQIIDFGLAGYWGESIVGTPTYLAPEVFKGAHHSAASDLYAIGIIFYNCLARSQPFVASTLQEVYDRHRTYTPPLLSDVNPKVPKYLSDIVSILLSKKEEERYPNAQTVIEEIAAYSGKKYSVETEETLLSYLPKTSELIGRKEAQRLIENQLKTFLEGKKPYSGIFLYGEHGVGKSKFVSQIKTRLQLEKISVEEAVLPMGEADRKILSEARVVILEDLDQYQSPTADRAMKEFLSFLEQRILSPESSRFLFIASSTQSAHWKPFDPLFPHEEFSHELIPLPALNRNETGGFVEMILGQKEIPQNFLEEMYRNTGGNPGVCEQIISGMIHQKLLFDESGRWSPDLLTNLTGALTKVVAPKSLDERLEAEYNAISGEEEEIWIWLAIGPHGLTQKLLSTLTKNTGLRELISSMLGKKMIRVEGNNYFLYRSAFVPFIRKNCPPEEQKKRHTLLASFELELNPSQIWYHESLGEHKARAVTALEKLGNHLEIEGRKEGAFECYSRLIADFASEPLLRRVDWHVKGADNLIWLDRFMEATVWLTSIENEVKKNPQEVSLPLRLKLLEKKGLSLIHQQKLDEAKSVLLEGMKLSMGSEAPVEKLRFENDLAQIELLTGHPEAAIPLYQSSRAEAQKKLGKEVWKITNNDLGHVYFRLKDFDPAIKLLKEDIDIFKLLPNREPSARAHYSLANCYQSQKKYSKAIAEYESCIGLAHQDNLLPLLLRAYNGLGNIHLVEENVNEALASYQKALELSVHLKDPVTKAALLVNQGVIYRRQKNYPQASRRLLLSKQILESREKPLPYEVDLLSKCYYELGEIAMEEKNSLKALSFKTELMRIVEQTEHLKGEGFPLKLELARLYLENRLTDAFESTLKDLARMAQAGDEKKKVAELEKKWKELQKSDHDGTMKLT